MSTLAGISFAIDVLTRVSLVLAISLALARIARQNPALRHAMLVAGLIGAFIMPTAMLTVRRLPALQWQVGLLSRIGLDANAIESTSSITPGEPRHPVTNLAHPAPAIFPLSDSVALWNSEHNASERPNGPSRDSSTLNMPYGRLNVLGLFTVWMIGTIAKLTGLGISIARLRRMVARAHRVTSSEVLSLLELVLRRIPMRKPPRLLESVEVSAPVAAGIIGQYVLLPKGWAENCRQGEVLAILHHETAHLARNDHRVVILQELLVSVLWFHPLVYLFNRVLNRAREEVCDNHAIFEVDCASYCEALLLLAVGQSGLAPRGATSSGRVTGRSRIASGEFWTSSGRR